MFIYKFLRNHLPIALIIFSISMFALPFNFHNLQEKAFALSGTTALTIQRSSIVDGSGKQIYLRGAMIESSFAYINRWKSGQDPTQTMNTNTFAAMHTSGMNAVRMNISQWIYNLNPSVYMQKLNQVVTQANQQGLYVIIDFHDDGQSGSPYGDGMLHKESLGWWGMLASNFKNNPMVLFDPINEPNYPDWCAWRYGGNPQGRCTTTITDTSIVGFLDVIAQIRAAGAKQIIVIEPGSAGGTNKESAGWATFNLSYITDPNILPSKHEYQSVITGNSSTWDKTWGPFLGTHPIYYGEWAALAHPYQAAHCTSALTNKTADGIVNTFLSYMQSRNANFTYWAYQPYELIQNYTNYAPSSYHIFVNGVEQSWTCGDSAAAHAGAGEVLKAFLTRGLPSPTPTHGPTPTLRISPTPTPSANSTTFGITIYLDGIGNAGDNSNPTGGNSTPLHTNRNIQVNIYNSQNQLVQKLSGQIFYGQTTGNFNGKIVTNTLASGMYTIKISSSQYLTRAVSGIQNITVGRTYQLPSVRLVTGDINGDNVLNILDYNLLMGCYSDMSPAQSCTATNHFLSDLNDDGKVNQIDYNLFYRELSVNNGQ